MAGLKWSNGGPQQLLKQIERKEAHLLEVAEAIVKETIAEARDKQISILELATTTTGFERMDRGQGNGPGRDDSGQMIDSIQTEFERVGNTFIGRWGWDSPEYYLAQDYGYGHIPEANSLLGSFMQARQKFQLRILRAAKGNK